MKKLPRNTENLAHIANNGAIAASDWTSGSGRYIRKRAIPDGAMEVNIPYLSCYTLPKRTLAAIKRLAKARPRVKKAIVITDWRKAMKAVRALSEHRQDTQPAPRIANPAPANPPPYVSKLSHPVTGELLERKRASGLTWREFEATL